MPFSPSDLATIVNPVVVPNDTNGGWDEVYLIEYRKEHFKNHPECDHHCCCCCDGLAAGEHF